MDQMGTAHKIDSDINWPQYPGVLQEVFQRRPKPKGKKQKSHIDDTRTEISYSASTYPGEDYETSTYVSGHLGTPSNRSVESKRSKKRAKHGSKKSFKDASGSFNSVEASSPGPETPEESKEPVLSNTYLVTLNCPLCDDLDCILNKAAQCPLLRHNESEPVDNDCCLFCGTTCRCEDYKKQILPVSGLVQRDENGIAVTLLKANGGPIENSCEWANRKRWVVPSYVRWEHKISEWITAPTQENMKADTCHRKKSHKFKNKRKGKPTPSTFTAAPEVTSNGEDPRTEEEDIETRLIHDGHGFKIFAKGKEKILINYDRKNCKYMGCNCVPADPVTCGCGERQAAGEKSITKHHKKCSSKSRKISILRETDHGREPIQKEPETKSPIEKNKSAEAVAEKSTASIEKCDESKQKLNKESSDKKEEQNQKQKTSEERRIELTGKDVRNSSRADFLERSLREMLGDDYRNSDETEKPAEPESHVIEPSIFSVPCPVFGQPGAPSLGDNWGACTCAPNCCYSKNY